MNELPLHFRDGHFFVDIDGDLWLLDTGEVRLEGSAAKMGLQKPNS